MDWWIDGLADWSDFCMCTRLLELYVIPTLFVRRAPELKRTADYENLPNAIWDRSMNTGAILTDTLQPFIAFFFQSTTVYTHTRPLLILIQALVECRLDD